MMLYGCGGATLDEDFFINLKQILAHGATVNVKVTVQMKLSKKYVEKVKDVEI